MEYDKMTSKDMQMHRLLIEFWRHPLLTITVTVAVTVPDRDNFRFS